MNNDAIKAHLSADPVLKELSTRFVLPPFERDADVYKQLLSAIVYQQLSGKAASTIYNRFLALFPDGQALPALLLAIEDERLRACGLSRQKAGYLRNVATFFLENDLLEYDWSKLEEEAVIQLLTQIKGVGRWTVEMILMFTLKRPDVLPLDDLGIQQAIQGLYHLTEKGKALKQRMIEIAEPWRPYRTYACVYLWRWKDTPAL